MGALALAALLLVLLNCRMAGPASGDSLGFPEAEDFASSAHSVGFGWRLTCDDPDPGAWLQLPGVGPVLARRLAAAAEAGRLQQGSDLQEVSGIGPKIAERLDPWVSWRYEDGRPRCRGLSQSRRSP